MITVWWRLNTQKVMASFEAGGFVQSEDLLFLSIVLKEVEANLTNGRLRQVMALANKNGRDDK